MAQVFKTRIDPFVHKLSFLRIFSGTLKKDDNVHVSGARKLVKLHQLLAVQGGETTPIDSASAGQIVAVAKVEELHTGLSLGDLVLPPIQLPTPMVGLALVAQKPWRRSQTLRRPAQDRRGGWARSACTAIRRPRSW